MKTIDEEGCKYHGILEYDKVKEKEMKVEFVRECRRRIRLILMYKLNGKNKIKAINSWAVTILIYGAGVLKCRVDELEELDRKTRKLLAMGKWLHSKNDLDRLYARRKERRRRLTSYESTVRIEENNLGCYLNNSDINLLLGVKHFGILEFRESVSEKDF